MPTPKKGLPEIERVDPYGDDPHALAIHHMLHHIRAEMRHRHYEPWARRSAGEPSLRFKSHWTRVRGGPYAMREIRSLIATIRALRKMDCKSMDEVTRRIRGDKRHDLSPAMVRALKRVADDGGRLRHVDRSMWSSCSTKPCIRSATVHALWRRGYLEPVGERWGSTPRPRKLTQKAHYFLARLTPTSTD